MSSQCHHQVPVADVLHQRQEQAAARHQPPRDPGRLRQGGRLGGTPRVLHLQAGHRAVRLSLTRYIGWIWPVVIYYMYCQNIPENTKIHVISNSAVVVAYAQYFLDGRLACLAPTSTFTAELCA